MKTLFISVLFFAAIPARGDLISISDRHIFDRSTLQITLQPDNEANLRIWVSGGAKERRNLFIQTSVKDGTKEAATLMRKVLLYFRDKKRIEFRRRDLEKYLGIQRASTEAKDADG
ncbi:MAG: hypothetical protein AAF591_23675 [Verrucomicrobiota bacterium]